MGEKKPGSDNRLKEDELIESEYEREEDPYLKPGKRLQEKERYSKKSDLKLKEGRVLEAYSKNYFRVQLADDEIICPLSGRLKNVDYSNRSIIAVGDFVRIDVSQEPRIEEIEERKNTLKRYIDRGNQQLGVIIAANIDQVIITTSCLEPPCNLNLVDRYLCSAEIEHIEPIVCVNKIDLADDIGDIYEQCLYYESIGVQVLFTSVVSGDGMKDLKKLLHQKDSLFSGASGTGKSSLINKLDPKLKLKTASVSKTTTKGKHTTSSSTLIPWSFGGYLIDTPGIKTFGLQRDDKHLIPRIFPGFSYWVKECKFSNCRHIREDGCRVLQAKEEQEFPEERYQSYLKILSSLD